MEAKVKPDSDRSDDEKAALGQIEGNTHVPYTSELPPDPDSDLSAEERAAIDRKLLWKLDLTLIPWLCILYLLAFLDRTNIGNAKIDNLQKDLHNMSTGKYNAALSIFFVSYSVFEPLTNVLLKRLRPSVFIPIIMVLWGLCMTFMGFVTNWSGLMAARWWLGFAEAGLFPGINYYLSCWYKRKEFGVRAAIFFSAAAVSGSFGGLLAAAIVNMDGLGGRPGWAWIFILEGIVTTLFGFGSFWLVHDFPDGAKFLSEVDRARVVRRLKMDQQSSAEHEEFQMKYVWMAVKDYKMWLGMIVYMGCDMPLYAFSLFLPSIISELGYSSTKAQLLSVPPYAAAAILTILIGFIADRTHQRGLCNIGVSFLGIAGFAMLLGSDHPGVKYAGVFLGAMGIYPCISNTISWVSNNIEGVYKRGVVLGFVIGWGNLNGIVSSNIYRKAPKYVSGHATVMGYMIVFLMGGSTVMYLLLRRENAARKAGKRDHWVEGMSEMEAEKLGDQRPDFFYTFPNTTMSLITSLVTLYPADGTTFFTDHSQISIRVSTQLRSRGKWILIPTAPGIRPFLDVPDCDFDFNDKNTWRNPWNVARGGMIKTIVLLTPKLLDIAPQMKSFIDFAIEMGATKFVLMSWEMFEKGDFNTLGEVHQYLAELQESKGINWVVVRPTWLMEFWTYPEQVKQLQAFHDIVQVKATRTSNPCNFDRTISFVAADDVADVIFNLLRNRDRLDNKELIGSKTGLQVGIIQRTFVNFQKHLKKLKLTDEEIADALGRASIMHATGQVSDGRNTEIQRITGHAPTQFEDWAQQHEHLWKWSMKAWIRAKLSGICMRLRRSHYPAH
ncbi:hypothetical protein B7494_g4398 [Chlorociboria aeruginascens]|nr:hypothetical protein B7494_g4398 [Chlorociboria aeruginascens]